MPLPTGPTTSASLHWVFQESDQVVLQLYTSSCSFLPNQMEDHKSLRINTFHVIVVFLSKNSFDQGSSFLTLAKKLPQYPVVPSLFSTTRATLKLSPSETLRPFPFSFLLVHVEVSFSLVLADRDLLSAESCPHQPCPILKIPDLREILRDKLLERLWFPSW